MCFFLCWRAVSHPLEALAWCGLSRLALALLSEVCCIIGLLGFWFLANPIDGSGTDVHIAKR